jgi:hypothetical protein
MIERRLQRVQALGVDVARLQDFPEERLDAIQALIDRRRVAIGSDPLALIERARRKFRRGATATHGKGF